MQHTTSDARSSELKKLGVQTYFCRIFNQIVEFFPNLFSTYIVFLLNYIKHLPVAEISNHLDYAMSRTRSEKKDGNTKYMNRIFTYLELFSRSRSNIYVMFFS